MPLTAIPPALLPRLGPTPPRMGRVAAVLLLTAIILLLPASLTPWALLPGLATFPDLPGTVQNHWLLHTLGPLGMTHSQLQMYPCTIDMVVLNGVPLDAMVSWPLTAVLGWPAGFTGFVVLTLWAVGLSTAWLAGRWWGSAPAALIAGLAAQLAAPLLRELAYGRPTQVFGAIFAPLALGLLIDALTRGSARRAVGAGLMLALSGLTYWFYGFFFGLGLAVVVVLAALERLPGWPRIALIAAAAALLPVLLPIHYTVSGLENQGGMEAVLWSLIAHGGEEVPLAVVLERRDIADNLGQGIVGLTPLWISLAGAGLSGRPRRWLIPAAWIGIGLSLAAGPWLSLPGGVLLPGPFSLVPAMPVLRRLWWPDRALFLVMPAAAVLIGGGALRILRRWPRPALAILPAALLAEAFVALPNLPMPTTPGAASDRARLLAEGQGPLLILPQGSTQFKLSHRVMLDQVHHGRPLVNGTMPPDSGTAPESFRRISSTPALKHLYGCADGAGGLPGSRERALSMLSEIGLTAVHIDLDALAAMEAEPALYLGCIEELVGSEFEERGGLRIYAISAAR